MRRYYRFPLINLSFSFADVSDDSEPLVKLSRKPTMANNVPRKVLLVLFTTHMQQGVAFFTELNFFQVFEANPVSWDVNNKTIAFFLQ